MVRTWSRWLIVLPVIMGLAITGCRKADPNDLGRSGPPPAGPLITAPSPPALCTATKPAPREPFPFNRDDRRRDALVRASQHRSVSYNMTYLGGSAPFSGIDVTTVAQLLTDGYLDPYGRWRESPTSWEIFQFMCEHPVVLASGYVISIDRDDYRTTLDDIDADDLTPQLRSAAIVFCTTGQTEMDSSLDCFWGE